MVLFILKITDSLLFGLNAIKIKKKEKRKKEIEIVWWTKVVKVCLRLTSTKWLLTKMCTVNWIMILVYTYCLVVFGQNSLTDSLIPQQVNDSRLISCLYETTHKTVEGGGWHTRSVNWKWVVNRLNSQGN